MENYSVLMTVYQKDDPEFARAGIDSMLAQTYKTNDFVLVCDGPLSAALDRLLESYEAACGDMFRVVRLPENVGLGTALRHGLPLCKNELVARMDNDDIAKPERCQLQVAFLEENPDCALVSAHMNEFDADPSSPIRVKKVPVGFENIKKYARRRNPFNHSAVMFRKSKVLEAGNYSTMRTNQDVELWVRMLNQGCRCENLDQVLVDFRFDSNTLQRRKNWKNSRLMIQIWKQFCKNGYCSRWDYTVVAAVQLAIYLMPKSLLNWVYDHLR